MPEYSYSLDNAELARYDAMAARALAHEASLWDKAGIVSGAAVVDLGCGPRIPGRSRRPHRTVGNRGRCRRVRVRRCRRPNAG